MKKKKSRHLMFGMAVCIACLIIDTAAVYGTAEEAERGAEEAQERLQEEQTAHNEAIAEQNRREVERASAEKIAAQYAAMGMEAPGDVQSGRQDMEAGTSENMHIGRKKTTPEELWERAAENGDFFGLYENALEKQKQGRMTGNSLSLFLDSLTVTNSPLADEVYPLTEITYEELKELFPINGAIFRQRERMKGYVRYVEKTKSFAFQYYWDRWCEEGTVLTVTYGDVNEEGKFTSIVLDTTQEVVKYYTRTQNRLFVDRHGYSGIADYNLGCEGFSQYLLKNKCLHVWNLMQLTGVEIDILDEEERPENKILCRSYDTEYGRITAFYYRNADDLQEYFAIKFEENETYDYILAKGTTGEEMRVEVKLK